MDDFAKEVITKMETYEKKEKRQFNKYDMAIGLFYGVGIFLGIGIFFVGGFMTMSGAGWGASLFGGGCFSLVFGLLCHAVITLKRNDKWWNTLFFKKNKYTIDLAKAQIRIAFEQAEKEVVDLHIRTSEGMKTAKMDGKQIGRVPGRKYKSKKERRTKEIIWKNSKDFNGTNSDEEVIKIAGVSRNSYYKYKTELKEEGL